jgi:hypothetical protein
MHRRYRDSNIFRYICSVRCYSSTLLGDVFQTGSEALHNLGSETMAPNRKLRLDEVRYALSTLDTKRILPAMGKSALSKVVHTLLVTDTPLVQSELAERADVTARSIRTHTERLAAFDFVRETDAGWRFALPFHTDEERGDDILPWFVATDDSESSETFVRDVLDEVVFDLLDSERYADPDDSVARALFAGPGEVIPALCETWEWLEPWIRVVQTLLDAQSDLPPENATATIGIEPKQVSLVDVSMGLAD